MEFESKSVLNGLRFIGKEINLFSASKLLMRDAEEDLIYGRILGNNHVIGKIDLMFDYKGIRYVVEAKMHDNDSNCFWNSLKVAGYYVYYKWQTGDKNIKPAIIIPAKRMKLEYQIVANILRITIFLSYFEGNGYKLKMIDEKPYWQQISQKFLSHSPNTPERP